MTMGAETLVRHLRIGICDDKCRAMEARSGCACAEAADEIDRLTRDLAEARAEALSLRKHNEGLVAIEAQKDAEIERLRLLAKRFANAVATGQRYEGLIVQAEDFIGLEQSAPFAELEPHAYAPSAMHMGDCSVCGHRQGSPIHSPDRRR